MPTAVQTPQSDRVRAKRRRRREQILHAALRAFREKGYHVTTLDDIAGHLGVRKTALYHYFPDKEAILYQCHRDSLLEVQRILRLARRRFRAAAQRLDFVIREHVRVMVETLEGSPLAFEVPALAPEHHRRIVALRDRYELGLRTIIEQGISAGVFQRVDPKVASFTILGAINWVARWYRPDGPTSAAVLGAQFARHLVGGLTCHTPR